MKVSESIEELRDICQVSHLDWASQGFAFFQIRRVSIYLTWVLLHLPLTANQVTLLAIATGLLASLLFGLNQMLAGLVVLQLSMVLDFCDGEVSRYKKQQSKEGSYLDKVYHFCVHPSVFAGVAVGAHSLHPATWVVAIGFVTTICIFANTMVKAYAGELAIWTHSKRFMKRLSAALDADPDGALFFAELSKAGVKGQAARGEVTDVLQKAKTSGLRQLFDALASQWDFPYIFISLSLALVIQLFVPRLDLAGGISPSELLLVLLTVTYPLWMLFFLSYILSSRQIERGYGSFALDLSSLLQRAMSTASRSKR